MELRTDDGLVIYRNEKATTLAEVVHTAMESGVKRFNKADLTGADLSSMIFKDITFTGAKFDRVKLRQTEFRDCWLEDAVFRACEMHRTLFIGSNMKSINVANSHFGAALFEECNLEGSNLILLGMSQRGHSFVMTYENGIAIIRAGCREFTLDEARDHWPENQNKEEGAKVTLARRVAHQRGWLPAILVQGAGIPIVGQTEEEPKIEEPAEEQQPAPAELPTETTKEVAQTVNA